MVRLKKGNNQIQRTQAPNINETPRNQEKGNVGGDNGGILCPISFSVKKPRQK